MNALRASAVGVGLLALVWAALFIARTEVFLGPTLRAEITKQASRRGVDIVIEDLRPYGIAGLELRGVWLRIPQTGDHALEVVANQLRITPDLGELLAGNITVSKVAIHDGHIEWRPWTPDPKPKIVPTKSPKDAPLSPPKPVSKPKQIQPVHITLVNVLVEGHHSSTQLSLQSRAPLSLSRVDLRWDGDRMVDNVGGYGFFPDGESFSAFSIQGERTQRIRIEALKHTALHKWLADPLGAEVTVRAFSICLRCEEIIRLEDVELNVDSPIADVRLVTPQASLAFGHGQIQLWAQDMEFPAAQNFGLLTRITDSRLRFYPKSQTLDLSTKFVDADGGRLDVEASLSKEIRAKIFAENFDASRIFRATNAPTYVVPGEVNGTAEIHYDPKAQIVELTTSMRVLNTSIDIARLSTEPLTLPAASVRFDALADLNGKALSVARGRMELGPSAEISFGGRVTHAARGYAFDAQVSGENILAVTLRDALPKAIGEIVQDAILDGTFDFGLKVVGHSEDPKNLIVEGRLNGDVHVLRDSPKADPLTLITNGPPPQLTGLNAANWRSYSQLPPWLPGVLLAAEDAAFFQHTGFDWAGLKAAMVHNLEHKSLERGGSTISQQVAKNVFLTHERTVSRKLQEAYLTWRMEQVVPKERILEIYLNIAEWGRGTMGIEGAAKRYFKTSADQMTVPEVALLAAILPNPARFGDDILEGRLDQGRAEKVGRILTNLRFLNQIDMPSWARWNREIQQGKFGRLQLQICEGSCR